MAKKKSKALGSRLVENMQAALAYERGELPLRTRIYTQIDCEWRLVADGMMTAPEAERVRAALRTSAEQLATIARRWVEAGWQRGDTGAVFAMYAPHFMDHGAVDGRAASREGNVAGIADLYRAFPDFFATVDDLIVDVVREKVAVRWSATGTHQGDFLGVAPTGRRITFRGIETLRVEDGLITERAGEWDGIAILEQIGAFHPKD